MPFQTGLFGNTQFPFHSFFKLRHYQFSVAGYFERLSYYGGYQNTMEEC